MRCSNYLLATVKEVPAEAEIMSHQLMLRAGMIRKLAAGIYNWLPLGYRVLSKVETIVHQEMERIGALAILMPTIQPAEIWQQSGRWDSFVPPLLKLQDRHQRNFCFGPTHEEVMTDFIRHELHSYKSLPKMFYQIQHKFRDELRPRSGIMRAREFLMKDAYSFDIDQVSMQRTYNLLYQAYTNIFQRLGLDFRVVKADTGAMGGIASHEFQILTQAGEDKIAISDQSDYAANIELAETIPSVNHRPKPKQTLAKIATPAQKTINHVCQFVNVHANQTLKTLIVKGTESDYIALVLRGDRELNEVKAAKLSQVAAPLTLASEAEIKSTLGCQLGYLGPVNLNIPMIVDNEAALQSDFVCGANEEGYHFQGANWERDVKIQQTADLRYVTEGDPSPDGHGHLQLVRGIEVGHIFQLGDYYSRTMNAYVLDHTGQQVPLQMGCYGIGVSRLVAACIEQNHDERGIIWPQAMAPFEIALVPINMQKSQRVKHACETLYNELCQAGFEVLFDDRHERPGTLFADMDLIGIPHRLVISEKNLDHQCIEYKRRSENQPQLIDWDKIIAFLHQQQSHQAQETSC